MAIKKFGKFKIVVLDNGTARATATPTDSVGITTVLPSGSGVPAWTASDPAVTISPDAADPSGLSAIFGPATPPALVAAFTVSVSVLLPDGSSISGTSESNSIVAGGPTGFSVAVS